MRNLFRLPGCIFCGKSVKPWQKVRHAAPTPRTPNGITAHVSCYEKRLRDER